MTHERRIHDLAALTGGLAAVAAGVFLLRSFEHISPATVGLLLLVLVLAASSIAQFWVAAVLAVVAAAAFNYFFFPPIGTFTIDEPENWVAVVAFLLAAVIASRLSAAAQARTREAIARRNEVTSLFDLTRDVLLMSESAGAIDALARHVARRFELSRVAICLPADADWHVHQGGAEDVHVSADILNNALARARGTLEFDAHRRAYGGHVTTSDASGDLLILPLRHGTKAIGLLAADASAVDIGTLDAVAGVAAIAIERTQLLHEREAAELVRQKADLAATLLASLSHDLRTPLTSIRAAIENLGGELAAAERRSQADTAIVELDRLNRLFQDILDMARIDAAAIHVEREWVTPADIVDAGIAHVRHIIGAHVVRVDADAATEVEIDPRIASVALSHLLENAAHYSSADRAIEIDARAGSDGLRIAVRDHGPGLDPGELDHLFERFFRGRTARQLSPGTGMGLSITRGLLAAAGGHVWAENVPDGGARFTMLIPAVSRPVAIGA